MGLFSSKKTYVSSSVYNMAGDIKDRPNFLKTTITGQTIIGGAESYSEAIQKSYLNGPGLKLRSYGVWGSKPENFPTVGTIQGQFLSSSVVTGEDVKTLIPTEPGQGILVQQSSTGPADYGFWAEQYMFANHPDLVATDWVSDFNESTNTITITFEDSSTEDFQPAGMNPERDYLYALYSVIDVDRSTDWEISNETEGPWPSTDGWVYESGGDFTDSRTLKTTMTTEVTYSNNVGNSTETTETERVEEFTAHESLHVKDEFLGSIYNPGATAEPGVNEIREDLDDFLVTKKLRLWQYTRGRVVTETFEEEFSEQVEDGNGGTRTKTTKFTTTTESLETYNSYSYGDQKVLGDVYLPAQVLIYEIGSGGSSAIDSKFGTADDDGYFMPFIPVRLDNVMVDGNFNHPSAYEEAKRAYKKLTGSRKYNSELLDEIRDHESVDDMDFVYVMLGASLNTKEDSARRYIYEFFDRARANQTGNLGSYTGWLSDQSQAMQDNADWVAWRKDQDDPQKTLFGVPKPPTSDSYVPPTNQIRIRGNGSLDTNMDIRILWGTITKESASGQAKPGAKTGECFIEFVGEDQIPSIGYNKGQALSTDAIKKDRLVVAKQTSESTYEFLTIYGLEHQNFVYNGKSVVITAKEAMEDPEESGFIMPIHMGTYRNMPMVQMTQMSTACVYVVINTYVVKKTGFFGSAFFKIILVVAVVAVTVATGGAGALGSGVLGSSASIGAAVGLSGVAALVVGAIANTIAAMIITKIITKVSTEVLGDKLGSIVGVVASILVINGLTNLASGGSFTIDFSEISKADKILTATTAVGGVVTSYIEADIKNLAEKTQQVIEDYEEDITKISEAYAKNIGYGNGVIDPMQLLDGTQMLDELPQEFLDRTLMTGSDIASLQNAMLSNFAEISLDLENVR